MNVEPDISAQKVQLKQAYLTRKSCAHVEGNNKAVHPFVLCSQQQLACCSGALAPAGAPATMSSLGTLDKTHGMQATHDKVCLLTPNTSDNNSLAKSKHTTGWLGQVESAKDVVSCLC